MIYKQRQVRITYADGSGCNLFQTRAGLWKMQAMRECGVTNGYELPVSKEYVKDKVTASLLLDAVTIEKRSVTIIVPGDS